MEDGLARIHANNELARTHANNELLALRVHALRVRAPQIIQDMLDNNGYNADIVNEQLTEEGLPTLVESKLDGIANSIADRARETARETARVTREREIQLSREYANRIIPDMDLDLNQVQTILVESGHTALPVNELNRIFEIKREVLLMFNFIIGSRGGGVWRDIWTQCMPTEDSAIDTDELLLQVNRHLGTNLTEDEYNRYSRINVNEVSNPDGINWGQGDIDFENLEDDIESIIQSDVYTIVYGHPWVNPFFEGLDEDIDLTLPLNCNVLQDTEVCNNDQDPVSLEDIDYENRQDYFRMTPSEYCIHRDIYNLLAYPKKDPTNRENINCI